MRTLFLLIVLLSATNAGAQDMMSNLLIDESIQKQDQEAIEAKKAMDAEQKALDEAKYLSQKNFKKMKLKSDFLPKPKQKDEKKETKEPEVTSPAPFGLLWGASIDTTKNLGVKLNVHFMEDYYNSFMASYLPTPLKDFNQVIVVFGKNDALWRILAYGKQIEDNANASEILGEYKMYYNLLEQKYGNAKQTYKGVKVISGKSETIAEIGNKDFLAQLVSGEAILYATFNDKDIGVALSVNVTGDGKTFLAIDYKNIKLFDNKEKDLLNAL